MTEEVRELTEELAVFRPTEVVEISLGEISAPVETATELTKLAILEKQILTDLLANSKRSEDGQMIIHPDALSWAKEYRMLCKDIHELTKGPQEKVMMKKMDIVGNLYVQLMKNNKPQEIIEKIKELQDGG